MKQEVKLGSRKIQIVRVEHSFSILPKGAPAKAIRDEVTIKLGSEWKHGTRDIVRGLNREEEAKYLPQLIGLNGPKSEKWEEKALEHWANFGFTLPNNDVGIELEIGFKLDENSEVVPINLEDYIKYNWAIGLRKQVIGEYDDNILPQHVARIIDKGKKQDEKEQLFAKLKDVNRDFLKLIRSDDPKDRDKIDWILETMGGPEGDGLIITSLSPIQREMELEKVKEKNINKFSEILSDQFLELKATIRKAISYGVSQLKLEGNTYFYGNVALGELDGAIGYFSDPSHVRERQVLNEAVKQSKK
jgi:hypothetical protein